MYDERRLLHSGFALMGIIHQHQVAADPHLRINKVPSVWRQAQAEKQRLRDRRYLSVLARGEHETTNRGRAVGVLSQIIDPICRDGKTAIRHGSQHLSLAASI